jgi:hypothetical protein
VQETNHFITSLFPSDGPQLKNLKFFHGEVQVTVEEFCETARSIFLQVDTGQSEGADTFPENLKRIEVDRFLEAK